ncbi:uncharacterized protein TRIVIDRAFT_79838 [Trichoderma virens Gv29-8]|uniref:WSC domain-containing protein n=1 Tax=Hypocrea virens (strain Gv29-8 / FGSC 10586) TaxID=413071 RepID=G9MNZ2_HYPVG|nr:uncharacterized protein TRIVIDRAFT_79838 [Trichoderma virens Gv29-8]EHK23594.1 hypothetical protein TRIVIDRAFT_79838 [Trichoderma virens Gv29-8]UKZ49893.1 hypothetical protein TrVGV298_004146 [Trichoderma virens]
MHLSMIMMSLGAQLALGYFTNTSEPLGVASKLEVHPLLIGDFRLFGCVASTEGFPKFKKIASTSLMNLDFCAASCPGKFFGTYNTDCYCGDDLDLETSGRVTEDLCDTPCPGDKRQTCGGLIAAARLALEKQRPQSLVLSLYVRIHGEDHDENHDDHEYHHDDKENHWDGKENHWDDKENHWDGHKYNNTWDKTPTRPQRHTFTSTITSTKTQTITSCPPWIQHCSVGHKTTEIVTVTTELCPKPEWHKKKIICYGGHCAPEEPCGDEHCERHRVICKGDDCYPEVCTDKEEWHKLVVCDGKDGKDCRYHQCDGEECNSKIVCYDGKCAKETCYGEECRNKFVCKGFECGHEQCNGDDCHKWEVCNGSGAECRPRPPCNGAGCPVPPPPAPRPEPPAPTHDRPGHEGPYPPQPPVLSTSMHGWPHPTQPPVVAGSTKLGAGVLAALLSFIFFL